MVLRALAHGCAWVAMATALGCSSAPPPDPIRSRPLVTGEPPWLLVRVEAVTVSSTRPGSQTPWDPTPEEGDGNECGLIGLTVGLSEPVTGRGATQLCQFDSRPRPQPRPSFAPDLVVLLSASGGATYQTYTAWDTTYHAFQSDFVVPVTAIPDDGLLLTVRDRDGKRYEDIGTQRLSRQQLVMAALAPTPPLLTFGEAQAGLQRLDVRVSPYPPGGAGATAVMDARSGMIAAPFRPICAGEVVEIAANGYYRTGSVYTPWIQPGGHPTAAPEGFGFDNEPFHSALSGSAIALVGNGDAKVGILVGTCTRFVSNVGGPLVVGVNDPDPRSNQGQLNFAIRVLNPSPDEWWYGQTSPCSM